MVKKIEIKVLSKECMTTDKDPCPFYEASEYDYYEPYCKHHEEFIKDLKTPCQIISIIIVEKN